MRRTRLFLPLLCCFSLFCSRASAQAPGDDLKAGTLVDCHGEKVVVFGQTESRDGRYALGWTVRPKAASAKAVDWTAYIKDDPITWLGEYGLPADEGDSDAYHLLDGVLDLRDGKFTVLVTDRPYFPHANRHDLAVAWSDDRPGVRYALVVNSGRWDTLNLWLVGIDASGVRVTDLQEAAGKAVTAMLVKKAPRDHERYATSYRASNVTGDGKPPANLFKGKTLRIPFDSEMPKSGDAPVYSGDVLVDLPKGNVLGVANVTSE